MLEKRGKVVWKTLALEFGTLNMSLMSSGCGERGRKEIGVGLGPWSDRKGTAVSHGDV